MFWNNDRESFLRDMGDFMDSCGRRPSGTKVYLSKLRHLLEDGYSVNDLCGGIDKLIRDYSKDGRFYDPQDHNNTRSALLQVRKLLLQKLQQQMGPVQISWDKGWQSFCPVEPHQIGYCLEGATVTVRYSDPGHEETRELTVDQLQELMRILKSAKALGAFAPSNTATQTVHGPIWTYAYDYDGESGRDCCQVFTDEKLMEDFCRLIRQILKSA